MHEKAVVLTSMGFNMGKRLIALFSLVLAVAFATSGCSILAPLQKIESAVADVAEANQDFLDAYNALGELANDPKATQARTDLADGVVKLQQAIDELTGGSLDESCASRCDHECDGIQVASCVLNCSNSNCHPSCCGCKDGGAGCAGCGASCGHSIDGKPVECKRE